MAHLHSRGSLEMWGSDRTVNFIGALERQVVYIGGVSKGLHLQLIRLRSIDGLRLRTGMLEDLGRCRDGFEWLVPPWSAENLLKSMWVAGDLSYAWRRGFALICSASTCRIIPSISTSTINHILIFMSSNTKLWLIPEILPGSATAFPWSPPITA